MTLTQDGFTQNSQKAAILVFATATASRMTATLSGLGKMSHHGSGQGRPHIVSANRVQEHRVSMTAMGVPNGRRPHRLRLYP